ncbi:MAG: PAS domain S-box protein, partial [Acidobacteriota bacterium]
MLDLLQGQRKTSDPDVMMRAAAETVGRYLSVDRTGFFEMVDDDNLAFSVGWTAGRLPLLTGAFPAVGIGTGYLTEVRSGKTMGIFDASKDSLTADSKFPDIGTVSLIGVPIIRHGRWRAGFYVNHSEHRRWTDDEIALVQHVGEQTWDAVERARAEIALRKSEERLTFALEAGGGVETWDWDIPSDRVYASPRFAELFSVSAARAAAGAPLSLFLDAISAEDRHRVGERIREASATGAVLAEEYRVIQSDGSVRWIYARGRCHLDADGEPLRFPGVVFDITERKKTESALRQQWEAFDTVLSNTPDFAYTFDLDGRFTYVNRSLLSLWQRTLEDSVGKNFFDLAYPQDLAERLQRQIQDVIRTKAPVRDHTPFTDPNGETGYYEYIFVPVLAQDGQVQAVAGSTRDITELRRAEEAIRESEARFRSLAESIPQMVWSADETGHIFWYNRRWYDYTGTTFEEMEGWGWEKVHDPKVLPSVLAQWKGALSSGEP